jgi:hypothetical protein
MGLRQRKVGIGTIDTIQETVAGISSPAIIVIEKSSGIVRKAGFMKN